jgi:hypothetical protein
MRELAFRAPSAAVALLQCKFPLRTLCTGDFGRFVLPERANFAHEIGLLAFRSDPSAESGRQQLVVEWIWVIVALEPTHFEM